MFASHPDLYPLAHHRAAVPAIRDPAPLQAPAAAAPAMRDSDQVLGVSIGVESRA